MKGGALRTIITALALLAVAGLSLAVVLGFFGTVHPAFDSLAHFRIHFAAMLLFPAALLVAVARRRERRVGILALVFSIAVAGATIGTSLGGPVAPAAAANVDLARYRLLHLNLRFDNPDASAFLSQLGDEQPDVVTLVEVSDAWAERLKVLEAAYPYSFNCRRGIHIGGSAILSK